MCATAIFSQICAMASREFHLYPPTGSGSNVSLQTVLDALLESSETESPMVVFCHGGVYPLPETVLLNPRTSLTLRAVPGEPPPVFDCGLAVTGWKSVRLDGRMVLAAPIPERALAVHAPLDQLFVNGKRKTRASFPKSFDGFPIDTGKTPKNAHDRFVCPSFDPAWFDPVNTEALLFQLWVETRLPLRRYDAATGLVEFDARTRHPFDERTRVVWQNVREALTDPGEFFVDRRAGIVYYIPEDGETAESLSAVFPAPFPAFVVAGASPDRPCRSVVLDGLVFRHAGTGRPDPTAPFYELGDALRLPAVPDDYPQADWRENADRPTLTCAQADYHIPGALVFFCAADCAVRRCTIEACGGTGIQIARACHDIVIESCTCSDLGACGINVCGSASAETDPATRTSRISIIGNTIANGGRFWHSAAGILLGHTFGNLVEHNQIRDFYYTGISVGWNWGYADQVTRENRIGWNRIEHLGKGVLCDMGGIYLLGVQPGTNVYANYIADITCRHYGGWGIYTDEGSSGIVIERNICLRCCKEFFHQHYGRENILRYNIGAFPGEAGFALSRGTDQTLGFPFLGICHTHNVNFFLNVLLVDGKPFFHTADANEKVYGEDQFFSERNLFFDVASPDAPPDAFLLRQDNLYTEKPIAESFDRWRKNRGHDLASLYADPGFADAKNGDFSLTPESPLHAMHFPDPAEVCRNAGPIGAPPS